MARQNPKIDEFKLSQSPELFFSPLRPGVHRGIDGFTWGGTDFLIADGTSPEITELAQAASVPAYLIGQQQSATSVLRSMTAAIAGLQINTLHLVAHGRPGELQIAGAAIDAHSIKACAQLLAIWRVKDIALWSCEVLQDDALVKTLEQLTGARVHATTRRLGSTVRGVDWSLETDFAPNAPFEAVALASWPHQLATFTFGSAYVVTNVADKESNSHNFNPAQDLTNGAGVVIDGTTSRTFSGNDVSATLTLGSQLTHGWISRPIKVQGEVVGFYMWTDNQFTNLALAQADGNTDADRSTADNTGYILVVPGKQAFFTSGSIGSSSDRVDSALNSLLTTDPLSVNDISVNEASPYAVWTVTGTAGVVVTLALGNDSDPSTANATIGTDTGTQLQYYNGSSWVNYGATATIPASGTLLV